MRTNTLSILGEGLTDDAEITDIGLVDAKQENANQEVIDLSIHTSLLLTAPITVIPKTSSAPATAIPPPILPFIPLPQQSTQIPTPTTTEATTSTTTVPNSETLSTIHLRVSDLEKEYLGTSLDDALYKVLQRHTSDLTKEHYVPVDVVEKLKQQYKPYKSAKDIRKVHIEHAAKQQEIKYTITLSDTHKALYHALMESILEDEDAMDKGLKRKKISKDDEPSKKAKSTETSKGTTKLQPKDWFKIPERPLTPDPKWKECDRYPFDLSKPLPLIQSRNRQIVPVGYFFNNDLAYLQGGSIDRTYTTSLTNTKAAKYDMQGIEDMALHIGGPKDKPSMDMLVTRSDQQLYKFMEGDFPRLHINDIQDMLLLIVQHKLFNLKGDVIVHLATTLRMFTRRIKIQKRVEDLQLGVESY
ncbi:hypothetical protein Tco_0578565 [Tanacetum coccineum]